MGTREGVKVLHCVSYVDCRKMAGYSVEKRRGDRSGMEFEKLKGRPPIIDKGA